MKAYQSQKSVKKGGIHSEKEKNFYNFRQNSTLIKQG